MQRKAIMKPGIILPFCMTEEERERFNRWLKANGINPNYIPLYARMISHGKRITFQRVIRKQKRSGGKRVVKAPDHMLATKTETKRIRVPFEAIR